MGLGAVAGGAPGRVRVGVTVPEGWRLRRRLLWWPLALVWAAAGRGGFLPAAAAAGITIQFGGSHRGGPPGDDSDDERWPPRELSHAAEGQRPLELTEGSLPGYSGSGAESGPGSGPSGLPPPQPSFAPPGAAYGDGADGSCGVAVGPADPSGAWAYAWQTTCAWAAETFVRPVRKTAARATGARGYFSRKASVETNPRALYLLLLTTCCS
jgi:hypothetical protein